MAGHPIENGLKDGRAQGQTISLLGNPYNI